MASYSFTKASSQQVGDANSRAFSLEHSHIALIRPASIPGAAVYNTICGWNSATLAREAVLQLDGGSSGTLSYKVGATRVNPSTNIVPATNKWQLVGATKGNGTVTVQFFMYDFETGTWTEFASSGTVANRTQAASVVTVGARQSADYFDGNIAAVLMLPFVLKNREWRNLVNGREAWRALQGNPSSFVGGNAGNAGTLCSFIDLTMFLTQFPDIGHRAHPYATRTAVLSPALTPPGW